METYRFIVLGCFLSNALVAGENAAAVAQFGEASSAPLRSSILFIDGELIEPPHKVVRKGLAIYINDKLVRPGREWPPFNSFVEQDPGVPSPDFSPLDEGPVGVDRRTLYWAKKWRYLCRTEGADIARDKMAELYRQHPKIKNVKRVPSDPLAVYVTDARITIAIELAPEKAPDVDALLRGAERSREHFTSMLRSDGVIVLGTGGYEFGFGAEHRAALMEIVKSGATPEEKLRQIVALGVARQNDLTTLSWLRSIKISEQGRSAKPSK